MHSIIIIQCFLHRIIVGIYYSGSVIVLVRGFFFKKLE